MGIRLEDLPPAAKEKAIREMARQEAHRVPGSSFPSTNEEPPQRKRNAQPVLVRAEVFCTKCGSYEHQRHVCPAKIVCQAFALPLRSENTGNGDRRYWTAEQKRRKRVRQAIAAAWRAAGVKLRPAGYRVTVTRISAGELDKKNLEHALKSAVDAVASLMGVDDSTPIVDWAPSRQEKGEAGKPAVRIEIEELR